MRSRVAALALVVAAGCSSMPKRYYVKPFPYQGFSAAYPTGMRLVVYELPHMPEAMVSASYRVGSVDDPPGKAGMAHLVEHLTFRARPGGGPRLWDRYDALGIEFNAFTFADSTEYDAVFPAEDLDKVLALEESRLREPLGGLTEKDFQVERDVVLRELAQRRDPASATSHLEWLRQRLAPGTPYAAVPTEESLRSITLDEVRAFVRAHYTPAHLILVVTGPRPGQAVARSSQLLFAELAVGAPGSGHDRDPVRISPPVVALDRAAPKELEVREAPVERPLLWVAWALPGEKERAGPQALVAERFLEGAIGWVASQRSHLHKIRSVETFAERLDGVTIVAARIELRSSEDGPTIFEAIRSARDFRAGVGGVDPWEAPGVRTALLMNAHLGLDALEQVGIASFIRSTGEVDYIGGWPKEVAVALSTDGLMQDYFRTYATSERLAGMLVVPSEVASPVPTTRVGGASEISEGDHHGQPELELAPGDPLKLRAPSELAGVVRKKLENGLELVVIPRQGFRAVSVGMYARTDPAGPSEDFLRWMALWSTNCASPGLNDAWLSFTMRHPTDLVEEHLRVFPCYDVGPHPNAPELAETRRYFAEILEKFPPTPGERASAALLAALFPGHPYADAVLTPERVRSYGDGEASRWITRAIRPERTSVVVSGDVETTPEALEALEARFGRWKVTTPPIESRTPRPPSPEVRRVLLSNRTGWTTAEILVGIRAPPRAERDEPAFLALAWRLSHDLNSRLRIARGETYGVSVQLLERSLGSALLLSTVVSSQKVSTTLASILGELAGLSEPADEQTVARARWQVARQLNQTFGTTARNRNRLGELALYGLPADEWDTFLARTASLTPERLVRQAQELAIEREIVLVVGDAAVLAPVLRARGLEVEVLPATQVATKAGSGEAR